LRLPLVWRLEQYISGVTPRNIEGKREGNYSEKKKEKRAQEKHIVRFDIYVFFLR
jgi:hypothetical protein